MNILIRTDGSRQLGNGHIVRMFALADELFQRNIQFTFALKFDDYWINKIREKGFPVIKLPEDSNHLETFLNILIEKKITHLVYDTRSDLSKENLAYIKNFTGLKVIVIDSPENTRIASDIILFPPIPQIKEWSWIGFNGQIFSGWEYVLLRKEFLKRNLPVEINDTTKILLSFGSTDPFYLTEKILKLIVSNKQMFKNHEFVLLAGPQFDRLNTIRDTADFKELKITIRQSPEDIVTLFRSVDFAFIAFGVTAYELAALSIPFLCISLTEDHERSSHIFEDNSLGVSLGLINNFAEGFKNKIDAFFERKESIKKSIKEFQLKNSVCDWSKIIHAIIN